MRQALPAFARHAREADTWPGKPAGFGEIRASRRIATLADPPQSLYLLATATSGTCLELVGLSGDCNDASNFFGQSPFQLLDADPIVAGVLAPAVTRVRLRTPTGTFDVDLNADHATLFRCPRISGRRSCAGDELIGINGQGRQLFAVPL